MKRPKHLKQMSVCFHIPMAHVKEVFDNAIKSPAGLHKGFGFAVDERRWYVAECRPTGERMLRTMLQKAGYEAYVASRVEDRVYRSRNRRRVERILLPCRVFVRTEASRLPGLLSEYSSIYRFLLNRAVERNEFGRSPFAFVPEEQMRQLQYVLGQASNPVYFTADDLRLHQRVRVMRGLLSGVEGLFWQKGSSSYIVLRVEMGTSHYVYTEVNVEDVQPID